MIFYVGHVTQVVYIESLVYKFRFDRGANVVVQISDGQQVVIFENGLINTQFLSDQSNHCYTTPLAVAAIAHLVQ